MSKYYSLVLAALPAARSHSWVDSITCVCNGQTGYARNYPGRSNPRYPADAVMTNKVVGRQLDAFMVSKDQREPGQMEYLPRLSCPANSELIITYTPNGHLTKDTCSTGDTRCKAGGPPPTSYWYIHWNQEFDGRQLEKRKDVNTGTTLTVKHLQNVLPGFTAQPFGDGSCGEEKSGKPCVGRFTIPVSATPGVTQFVWNWVFDRAEDGGGEEYFTFFDIEISKSTTTCGKQEKNDSGETSSATATTAPASSTYRELKTILRSISKLLSGMTNGPVKTLSSSTCLEVTAGDTQAGISAVSDTSCPDAVGCREDSTNCRFCRVSGSEENDANKHFAPC